jgi:hypothetical protein
MPSKWSVDLAKASQALTNVGEKTLPKPPGYEIVSEMVRKFPVYHIPRPAAVVYMDYLQ